jgi:hypothetical protein
MEAMAEEEEEEEAEATEATHVDAASTDKREISTLPGLRPSLLKGAGAPGKD